MIAPAFAAPTWLGETAAARMGSTYLRVMGARDTALSVGAILAPRRGTAVKPWLRAAALAEAADVVVAAALSAQMEPRQRVMALAGPAWLAAVALALSRRARPAN